MAIVEVSIVPIGTGSPSVSSYVAQAVKVLQGSGLLYQLTPMGTIIEGSIDEILSIIRQMHESCFNKGVVRVLTYIKIDDRRDRIVRPEDKVISVEQKIEKMEDTKA